MSISVAGTTFSNISTFQVIASTGYGGEGGSGGDGGYGENHAVSDEGQHYLDYYNFTNGKAGAAGNGGAEGNADINISNNSFVAANTDFAVMKFAVSFQVNHGGDGGYGGSYYTGWYAEDDNLFLEGSYLAQGKAGANGTTHLVVAGNTFDGGTGKDPSFILDDQHNSALHRMQGQALHR